MYFMILFYIQKLFKTAKREMYPSEKQNKTKQNGCYTLMYWVTKNIIYIAFLGLLALVNSDMSSYTS